MLTVLLHLSTISKKYQLDKCLYHRSEWNLTASNFQLAVWLK